MNKLIHTFRNKGEIVRYISVEWNLNKMIVA